MDSPSSHFDLIFSPRFGVIVSSKKDRVVIFVSFHPQGFFGSSIEKRAHGCLGYIGDDILPSYIGIISLTIVRIPINQPGFNGK